MGSTERFLWGGGLLVNVRYLLDASVDTWGGSGVPLFHFRGGVAGPVFLGIY